MYGEAIVNVKSVTLAAPSDIGSATGAIDNLNREVEKIGCASVHGVSGDFKFVTIEFEAKGFGTTALEPQDTKDLIFEWANGLGDRVAFSATDGSVTVAPIPLPAALWLLLSRRIGLTTLLREPT